MLNCREISERTSDFVDAALPWRAQLEVRLHVMMCRFCREYVRQIRLVARTLGRLPRLDSAPAIDQELLELFRAGRR